MAGNVEPVRFYNRDGEEITSLDEWGRLGKPAADSHWKPGSSAYELAAQWIERDAEQRVTELLSLRRELAGVELLEGIAEKQTRFDDIQRGPRNHDLLVRAMTTAGPLVVAVEGKADEAFDHPLWRWRQRALRRSPHSEAPRRVDRLTALFFGTTIDKDLGHPPLGCLGYQLLSALAGSLADAREAGATHAVLLVHEFVTSETDDSKHAANAHALEDFVIRLAGGAIDRADTPDGWISEPIPIRGDGTWLPDSLPVLIAKLLTNRRTA